jgi:hypothetical protein
LLRTRYGDGLIVVTGGSIGSDGWSLGVAVGLEVGDGFSLM